MASDREFVQYVVDQIDASADIRFRAMFGGYTLYSRDKVVALICDRQLFIKPTEAGRSFIGKVVEAPPYPGAKKFFLVGDRIDDTDWLTQLIALSEAELPKPKPRKKKKKMA